MTDEQFRKLALELVRQFEVERMEKWLANERKAFGEEDPPAWAIIERLVATDEDPDDIVASLPIDPLARDIVLWLTALARPGIMDVTAST